MDNAIADLMAELSREFRTELRRSIRIGEAQPTPFQGEVMAYIGRHPGTSLYALAQHTARDKGQITRLIKELEALGLATRARPAGDRRVLSVSLTAKGKEAHRQVLATRARIAAAMLKGLSLAERGELLDMLHRMRAGLREVAEARPMPARQALDPVGQTEQQGEHHR